MSILLWAYDVLLYSPHLQTDGFWCILCKCSCGAMEGVSALYTLHCITLVLFEWKKENNYIILGIGIFDCSLDDAQITHSVRVSLCYVFFVMLMEVITALGAT